uniref:PID domain-containing protein n=1 Tax=Timema bartmani TaxID=61472 RepID=A0A7R9ET48_9NEOP|nr:unnamed protein product [Timema bartmani]
MVSLKSDSYVELQVEKRVTRAIGDQPLMDFAGANVNLSISSMGLVLTALESGRVIARHEMPRISFASGGDTDTLDFVAYVAKDMRDWRACFVLECGGGLAQDVITSIGQAFELRFQQFFSPNPTSSDGREQIKLNGADRDYYNDLPGKIPPEMGPPPVPPLPSLNPTRNTEDNLPRDNLAACVAHRGTSDRFAREPFSATLPNRNNSTPAGTLCLAQRVQLHKEAWFHGPVSRHDAEALLTKVREHSLIHCTVYDLYAPLSLSAIALANLRPYCDLERDFAMALFLIHCFLNPFFGAEMLVERNNSHSINVQVSSSQNSSKLLKGLFGFIIVSPLNISKVCFCKAFPNSVRMNLSCGTRNQINSISKVVFLDGDFLVRESQGSPGQYVLTGMQSGIKKHLLLVDPEGVVRMDTLLPL